MGAAVGEASAGMNTQTTTPMGSTAEESRSQR